MPMALHTMCGSMLCLSFVWIDSMDVHVLWCGLFLSVLGTGCTTSLTHYQGSIVVETAPGATKKTSTHSNTKLRSFVLVALESLLGFNLHLYPSIPYIPSIPSIRTLSNTKSPSLHFCCWRTQACDLINYRYLGCKWGRDRRREILLARDLISRKPASPVP